MFKEIGEIIINNMNSGDNFVTIDKNILEVSDFL